MPSRSLSFILAGVLSAAAHAATGGAAQATVSGSVRLSPTCAGPQHPGQDCSGPLTGAAVRLLDRQGKTAAQAVSADDGSFALHAAPGRYTLRVDTQGAYPQCESASVILVSGQHRKRDIACDSGMR